MRRLFFFLSGMLLFSSFSCSARSVKLSEVDWHGTSCYKIDMPMGTVYFEKGNGVSGFKSFIDSQGNDWIASYLPPGPKGQYRGFPNSVGNFGHAGRDSGSVTTVIDGVTEGESVILESSNQHFTFRYHFLADRIAIEVLESSNKAYPFLLETVAGGSADEEDYFVAADGIRRIPTVDGELYDLTPEWIYVGDPKVNDVLFFAKTPEDDAPNENHRQYLDGNVHNMDLYSFGRTGAEHGYVVKGMRGNNHVAIIGFTSSDKPHNEIAAMIEGFLAKPFLPGVEAIALWGWHLIEQAPSWYKTSEAKAIADSVIQYQSYQGAWPENIDLARPPVPFANTSALRKQEDVNSLENGATILPMLFLARMAEAAGTPAFDTLESVPPVPVSRNSEGAQTFKYRTAFLRGLDFLFAAQRGNGSWPKSVPLQSDDRLTPVSIDSMRKITKLLQAFAAGDAPYGFVDNKRRKNALDAAIRVGSASNNG